MRQDRSPDPATRTVNLTLHVFEGDLYTLDRVDVERSPTFYCGPANKCRRHREVCLYPPGTTVFDRPGRCVEQPFHGCGGTEGGECIDDGSGGHYLIR